MKTSRAIVVAAGLLLLVLGLIGGTAAHASIQTYSITDLGTLAGFRTLAYGINGNGQVVGQSYVKTKTGTASHGFLYSAGKMTDLGTLGGDYSVARAINSAEDVAGFSTSAPDVIRIAPFFITMGT